MNKNIKKILEKEIKSLNKTQLSIAKTEAKKGLHIQRVQEKPDKEKIKTLKYVLKIIEEKEKDF